MSESLNMTMFRLINIRSFSRKYFGLSLIMTIATSIVMPSANAQTFEALSAQLDRVQQRFNVPGMGLIIVDQEKTLHEAYKGWANREAKQPVNEETVFRIGSITKTFTSLAALRLQEMGKLNLSDKVVDHVAPPYTNNYSAAPIRIAHLLEHTAGFQDMDQKEWDFKQPHWTLEQSFQYSPRSRTTRWVPGAYSSYTNSGAGVAAYVIEKASGQNFEQFVKEQIFDPLGLRDATFMLDDAIKNRLAVGYNSDGESVIPYWHMLYRPFGAMNTRVSEMGVFLRMLINEGRADDGRAIFSEESIRRLETPQTTLAAQHDLEYGYGLGNYYWIRDGVVFHGHGGDADGYLAHYGYSRANNRGYFLVINTFNGRALRTMRRHVEQWLIQGVSKITPPKAYRLNSEQLTQALGNYRSVTERFVWHPDTKIAADGSLGIGSDIVRVFVKDQQLFTQLNDERPRRLIAVNEHHFRRAEDPLATIAIVPDAEGNMILQGDIGNFKKER